MRTRSLTSVLLLSLVVLYAATADAKWWIFGKSDEEVSFAYLFLNKVSYEESGDKVTLYRDLLPDGQVLVNGRVRAGSGKVGSVKVSTDGKATWDKAKFTPDGVFEYRFTPEPGKTYTLYVEAMDTTGRKNDVDGTKKEVTVLGGFSADAINDALRAMMAAYMAEDPAAFMAFVGADFAGDATNLDRAVRRDFSAFDNISIGFTVNNIASGPGGRSFVSISYNRQVTSSRSGRTLTDRGDTEFVFNAGDGGPRLYSMKNPLIFGLSDASNVATGGSNTAQPGPVIIVDNSGNTAVVPAELQSQLTEDGDFTITGNDDGTSTITTTDGTTVVSQDGTVIATGAGVESGNNIILTTPGHPPAGFNFVAGSVVAGFGDISITGHTDPQTAYGWLDPAACMLDLGINTIGGVTSVPSAGYTCAGPMGFDFAEGHCYAVRLGDGTYGVVEIVSVSVVLPDITVRINYKYQPDGTTNF
ncbi:MAG: hypothetical protein HZC51_07080 [Nitrospirae bacterium]|nr:hypothetical protein [Nitrospirota bacterium]